MKNSFYFILILIFIAAFGCKSVKDFEFGKGQKELEYFNYSLAIEHFLQSWERDPAPRTARALAESYLKIRDFEQAEAWFAKLDREGMLFGEDYLGYAQVLIANSNYEEAKKILRNHDVADPDTTAILQYSILRTSSELGKELMNSPTNTEVSPLDAINTPFSDFGGIFTSDSTLLFVNDELLPRNEKNSDDLQKSSGQYGWTGNGFLKVYQTSWDQLESNVHGDRSLVEKFLADLHVGPVHISENFIFFTITKNQEAKTEKFQLKSKGYIIHPEVFYLENNAEASLDEARPLPFNSGSEYTVSDPFYDPVSNKLYFSSTMPGGYGGADLYYTYYLGEDKWIAPINLGSEINSPADERSPFIAPDNGIYFSSNGLGGMGGLDVFYSMRKNGKFTSPVNMGSPINSNRDDFFFFLHPSKHNTALISSDRAGGKGSDDLYVAELDFDRNFMITGKVIDQTSKKPISDVVIRLVSEDKSMNSTFISEKDGSYSFEVNANQKVNLYSRGFGYFEKVSDDILLEDVFLSKDSVITQDIELERIEVGGVYKLENIYYEYGQWELSDMAKAELDKVVKLMKRNPTLKINLNSHTDSRGDARYNLSLSEKRANAAVKYMVNEGISPLRVQGKGFGEGQLVNHCGDGIDCFEPEHEENRRTEFLIVDF